MNIKFLSAALLMLVFVPATAGLIDGLHSFVVGPTGEVLAQKEKRFKDMQRGLELLGKYCNKKKMNMVL